jgi:hypothetical protein
MRAADFVRGSGVMPSWTSASIIVQLICSLLSLTMQRNAVD